jgi:hypothetical protein
MEWVDREKKKLARAPTEKWGWRMEGQILVEFRQYTQTMWCGVFRYLTATVARGFTVLDSLLVM